MFSIRQDNHSNSFNNNNKGHNKADNRMLMLSSRGKVSKPDNKHLTGHNRKAEFIP